jgi:hypothetical protein
MKKTTFILTASLFSTAVMFATLPTESAQAGPLVQPQAQIAKILTTDGLVKIGRRTNRERVPPDRLGTQRPNSLTPIPNPNRPGDLGGAGYEPERGHRRHRGFRVRGFRGYGYKRGRWCHFHLYKVPGMRFHSKVRCGHRHYRAYRSWEWAY